MKDKKSDRAALLVPSDEEVNYSWVRRLVSASFGPSDVSGLISIRSWDVRPGRGRVGLTANRLGEGPAGEADNREQQNGDYAGCPAVGGIVAPGFGPWEQLRLGGGGGGGGHGSAPTRNRRGGQEVSLNVGTANVRMVGG